MPNIPFGWMPGHWGLKGKTRDIAQAEYELTGYDLEYRLLEIDKERYSDIDLKKKIIELKLKYGKLSEEEADRALISLIPDEGLRDLATVELDHKKGKITDLEYEKRLATVKKEPWVTVINMDFSKGGSLEGSFELDWNEFFVEKLKSEGYVGPSPDHIVNQWFMEVCRNVAMEEFDGTGDFAADSEANLDAVKRWSQSKSEPMQGGRKGYK